MLDAVLHTVGALDRDQFEPYMVDGQQVGLVHWLRKDTDGVVTLAGVWLAEEGSVPPEFEYSYPDGNETLLVLEGRLVVALPGKQPVELGVGDCGSFLQGTRSTWRLETPFRKFFVINR